METGRVLHAAPRLWTPSQGPSGLLVVARRQPLVAVVGNRLFSVGDEATASREGRQTVTLGGLIVISSMRQGEPKRVVGHPDLASGASVRHRDTLYVSVSEAIYRQTQGEEVEVHLTPGADDEEALASFRTRARRRWENDRLPDGWTRPLPPPSPKEDVPRTDGDDLPDELRALAEQIKAKAANRPA